eukprot:c26141_g2_i1 orf=1036-2181(-)
MILELAPDRMRQCCKSAHSLQMHTVDQFDSVPDSILLLILNRLSDIKALGRCCAVSKRLNALVPQVENVVVRVDCVISGEDSNLGVKSKGLFSHLVRFVLGTLVKPLQALQQFLGSKKTVLTEVSHHSPGEVLRNFRDVRNLRIELPGGELGVEEGAVLKWRAEFGSTLESCVILGASSMANFENDKQGGTCETGKHYLGRAGDRPPTAALDAEGGGVTGSQDDNGIMPESFYTNGGLKLRVVWTISSLIAASARHYLLQQIICDHPTLESLVLTDADGQGMLCMNKEQLQEFREKPLAISASSNRTQVPALNMKLWYAALLELPAGITMRGATLVAIRPSDQPIRKESELFVSSVFDEPFKSAATSLVNRRTYLLEMNSF